jgi:hypothetical protein
MAMKRKRGAAKSVSAKKEVKGTVVVTRKYKDGEIASSADSEEIDVGVFGADVAHVTVQRGITRNVGDYESVKLGVSVTLPTYIEEMSEAFTTASSLVGEYLDSEINKAGEMISGMSNDDDHESDDSEDDDADSEEEELDESDIKKMKKAELLELIEEENLDIDPGDHKGIKALREAVIESYFEEDEDEEDDEDSSGDDGGDDDDPYTQEELEDCTLDELKAVFKEYELGTLPKGRGKTKSAKDRSVKKQIIEAILEAQEE